MKHAVLAAVAALSSLAFSACQHVVLPPPPTDADALLRYRARVAPKAQRTETVTREYVDRTGLPIRSETHVREVLVLAGGDVVHYPEDLIPVVGARSDCGRAASDAASARNAGDLWAGAGGALAATSVLLFVVRPESAAGTTFPVSGAVAALGAGGLFVVAVTQQGDIDKKRDAAFSCYIAHFQPDEPDEPDHKL